ncbi:MAG: DUF6094 domain-containing protein [Fimbriimonadales bacterium]
MARLASIVKQCFYPAPPEAIAGILRHLKIPDPPPEQKLKPEDINVLDPCSGEGKALVQLAEGLGVSSGHVFAVELNARRAATIAANHPEVRLLGPCSFAATRISRHSISLVYFNPPFDDQLGCSGREEVAFLRQAVDLLVPGVMPALFGRHLMDKAIFLALEDMADNLPRLREYVGGPPQPDYDDGDHRFHSDCRVAMAPEQQREYKRVEDILVGTCREMLQRGSMKLLGAMLVTLLEYPDRPWDWTAPTGSKDHLAVGYWKTGSKSESDWEGVVQPASLSQTLVYPKEQALLDICRREVQAGNQVWVYCQMTGKRDIQPRLKGILTEAGFRVAIMRSRSVKTRDRLDWIEKEGKRADIVICHPQLVQTGLDFFGKKPGSHNFNAIAFYETGYNPFTMQQAARRAWRIGQSKDCRVYYLHYRDTMQQRAMALMARKMAAMMALDGRLSVEGLAGMADDESAAMALARSISDAIDSADIQRNWVKVASNRRPAASPLISFGQALLEDEPIDGLDILAIEPHLIAQTILDSQDEAGETTMSRDVLARMFEDFYSISDEELAELCTA